MRVIVKNIDRNVGRHVARGGYSFTEWLQNVYLDDTAKYVCKGLYGDTGGIVTNNQVPYFRANGINDKVEIDPISLKANEIWEFEINFIQTVIQNYSCVFGGSDQTRMQSWLGSCILYDSINTPTFSFGELTAGLQYKLIFSSDGTGIIKAVLNSQVMFSTIDLDRVITVSKIANWADSSNRYFNGFVFNIVHQQNGITTCGYRLQESAGSKIYDFAGGKIGVITGTGIHFDRLNNIPNYHQNSDFKRVTCDEGITYVPAIISDAEINASYTNVTSIELLTGMFKDDGSRLNLHASENETEISPGVTISDKLREKDAPIALQAGIKPDNYTATIDLGKSTKSLKLK